MVANLYETYLVPPSAYLLRHYPTLLPDWPTPPQQLLFIFFQAQLSLALAGDAVEQEKERLWQAFQHWGQQIYRDLASSSLPVEIICPRSGQPQYSQVGSQVFDLPALVSACLGWELRGQGDCKAVLHPEWQEACYPGLVVIGQQGLAGQNSPYP
ncbi:hypothetical protein [Synechocystis sp. LKSZ1]|uniref:hypothetical protein n=1 Tax=Synechocystis sp. LKSZ1 TaxID=3144951 RepID=UPI00336C2916